METAFIILIQVLIILALIIVGAVSHKANLISVKAADDMAAFCLKLVTPCVIINAFQIDFDANKLKNMLYAALLAVFTHVVAILLAKIFFGKGDGESRILRFATIYSNCGFMGIPLIEGAVGREGVLYASVYLVIFQALIWSHGVVTVKGSVKAIKFYKMFINSGTIGIAIALPFFFLSVSLPPVLSQTVSHIANLNTPLSMIVSGVYIARASLKEAFIRPKYYLCIFLKHIAVPFFVLVALLAFKVDETVGLSILLIAACPTASAVTLFSSLYGTKKELDSASRVLTLSNIISIITVPIVALIYGAMQSALA